MQFSVKPWRLHASGMKTGKSIAGFQACWLGRRCAPSADLEVRDTLPVHGGMSWI